MWAFKLNVGTQIPPFLGQCPSFREFLGYVRDFVYNRLTKSIIVLFTLFSFTNFPKVGLDCKILLNTNLGKFVKENVYGTTIIDFV